MEISVIKALEKIEEVLLAEGEMELYRNIAEVTKSHLEKEKLQLQQEAHKLELELVERRKKERIRQGMVFDNSAYWVRDGANKDGPFCYRCWHKTNRLIRMNPCDDPGWSECVSCNSREHTGA